MDNRVGAALWTLRACLGLLLILSGTVVAAASDSRLASILRDSSLSRADRAAGAVTLLKESTLGLDEQARERRRTYVAVQVFDDQAIADYAEIQVPYNAYHKNLTLDFARVLYPDGRIRAVSDDAVQAKTPPVSRSYTDLKMLTFALPTLERGAALEYQVTSTTRKQTIPGHAFRDFLLNHVQQRSRTDEARIDPCLRSRLTVTAPGHRRLVYATEHIQLAPQIVSTKQGKTYIWAANRVPGIPVEPNSGDLRDRLPRVLVSTIGDWRTLHDWADGVFGPPSLPTPKLRALAREVTRGVTSESEKIEALFYFVQEKVRYVSADLDRGGIAPHQAEQVWASRYGDCKDQTMLLVALLRSVGIEAYPALVNTFGQGALNTHVPLVHFSHMITFVPNGDSGIWIDTSRDVTHFPGLDWVIQGRWAFVIDGAGGRLLKTPESRPEDNHAHIRIVSEFSGRDLVGELALETSGAISDRMKLALRVNPNRDELLVSMVKALAATALVLETEFPGLGDPRAPFSAKARFKLSDALEPDQEFVHIIGVDLVLSAFTDLLTLPAPHARSCDYFFGVRMQLSQTTRYTVPSGGYEGNIFSPSGSLDTPHFSFVKSVDKGNDVITMRQRITLKRASVPHEEYGQFYENVQDLLEQSDVLVAFAKPDTSGMPTESAAAVREGTGRRGAGLLQRARNDLETGRYADAEALLEKALVADPQSGEAHYLLGVALGHLDQYQASAAAFKKARELGYRP